MNAQPEPTREQGIYKGLAIAIVAALVLLFTIVLPAERGYDPTGVGALLGLTSMNAQRDGGAAQPAIEDVTGGNDDLVAAGDAEAGGSAGEPLPLPNPAIHQPATAAPRTETFKVTLGFDGKTEIKAVLGKSKVMLYDWTVEGGEVYVDFHGHDPSKGDAYWVRYQEGDGLKGGSGSLVAPFAGEHGWFWLNVSDNPVTITLTVTGYQEKMIDYGLLP